MVFSRLASPKSAPNQPDSRREVRVVGKQCRTFENSSAGHFGNGTDLDQLEKTMAITILASLTVETCWDLRAQHGLLICQLYHMLRILVGFISAGLSQDPRLPSCMRSTSHSLMEHQACTASSVIKHCRKEATLIIPIKVTIEFAEGFHATALVRSMEWSYFR
jgi:hypothetical protein